MKYFMIALAMMLAMGNVNATNVTKDNGNASSMCDRALPVYDNNVRKRPLAVVNEGASPSFVNCVYRTFSNTESNSITYSDVKYFAVRVYNYTTEWHSVDCTGIVGTDGQMAQYMPKSQQVPPGGSRLYTWHHDTDNGGPFWKSNAAVQCLLPVNTGIGETHIHFRQN